MHIDKLAKPKLFFNIKGYEQEGNIYPYPNPIINNIKDIFLSKFYNGIETNITAYPTIKRPAFYSSANIFQFDKKNTNFLKITNVGEKEMFIDLSKAL